MSEKIVYAYVVADLLHVGHVLALENAKSFGDKLIVGVLTDEAVIEKKPKPILPLSERMGLIKALKCVDCVIPQAEYSPINNIKSIKPNILMESSSHSKEDLEEIEKIAESIGCKVRVMPYYPDQSSTKIKESITNNWKTDLNMLQGSEQQEITNRARGNDELNKI